MTSEDSSLAKDGVRTMLIGNVSRVFSDADAADELCCELYANMLDGVEAAAKSGFGCICVVMSDSPSNLSSALTALRKASSGAKIVLLAQMHEEPAALKLVGSALNGQNLADDYLICPVQTNRFFQLLSPRQSQAETEAIEPVKIDDNLAMKLLKLEELATTDDLTGLKNRRYIWEFSRQIIDYAKKKNRRVTLLVFDIDNFKHYNDVYGHSVGDKILKQAAVLLKRTCRPHDVVGRIGGDEFAVIFWDDPHHENDESETERRVVSTDHPKEPIFIAQRFRKALNDTNLYSLGKEGKGVLTISGGLASFPKDGSTTQQLFEQADKVLFDAKRGGKNRIYLVGSLERDISDI